MTLPGLTESNKPLPVSPYTGETYDPAWGYTLDETSRRKIRGHTTSADLLFDEVKPHEHTEWLKPPMRTIGEAGITTARVMDRPPEYWKALAESMVIPEPPKLINDHTEDEYIDEIKRLRAILNENMSK